MPLGPGVRYRFKKGTKVRLAFKGKKVVEAKNMKTGKVHMMPEKHNEMSEGAKEVAEYKQRHYAKRAKSGA